MDNFNQVTYEALNNYFTALSKLGYLDNGKVNQLLLLVTVNDFLEEFKDFITAEDYNLIDKIVTCLMGKSCLVPYSKFLLVSKPVDGYITSST